MRQQAYEAAQLNVVGENEKWLDLRARRERGGFDNIEIAEKTGLTREQVGKILNGKVPNTRSLGSIARALDELEAEAGYGKLVPEPVGTEGKLVKFRISGVYGAAEVVVEGPIENLAELQAAVDSLIRGQIETPGKA